MPYSSGQNLSQQRKAADAEVLSPGQWIFDDSNASRT